MRILLTENPIMKPKEIQTTIRTGLSGANASIGLISKLKSEINGTSYAAQRDSYGYLPGIAQLMRSKDPGGRFVYEKTCSNVFKRVSDSNKFILSPSASIDLFENCIACTRCS